MGSVGPFQILIVLVIALLVFGGRGRISSIMGDMAKGIRSFRSGLQDDDDETGDAKAVSKEDMVDVTPSKEKSESATKS